MVEFEYIVSSILVLSALYVSLSRDLLRISVAFFIEVACVSLLLGFFQVEYLALVVFGFGILATILFISFSSFVVGNLKGVQKKIKTPVDGRLRSIAGVLLGGGLGVLLGRVMMGLPEILSKKQNLDGVAALAEPVTIQKVGELLVSDHVPVFEVIAVMCLVVIVGSGLILRNPKNVD